MSAILEHRSPDPQPPIRHPRARLRACAGACAWTLLATLAAAALLAVFILVTETGGGSLAELMVQPVNLLRLAVMTVCLALWGYILRAGGEPDAP